MFFVHHNHFRCSANENSTLICDDCNEGITSLGNDENTSTFDDLAVEIDSLEDGGTINLTRDYIYESGMNEGIVINKSITINGNNHKLDGNGQSRIFTNHAGNVILNNLILVNGYHDKGGGIFVNSSVTCNNVVFENNRATDGGAMYVLGNFTLNDCIFDGNYAERGAAVHISNAFINPFANDTEDFMILRIITILLSIMRPKSMMIVKVRIQMRMMRMMTGLMWNSIISLTIPFLKIHMIFKKDFYFQSQLTF